MAQPWDTWPLTLPVDKHIDPTTFAEYKALNDRAYLSDMTKEIRSNAVERLRNAIGTAPEGYAAVIMGGKGSDFELYCSDTDKCNFRQESFFMHLFQLNEPDCFGIINLATGKSTLMIPFLPPSAARWNGPMKSTSYYENAYGVEECVLASDENGSDHVISEYLRQQGITNLLLLRGVNSDSGLTTKTTAQFTDINTFTLDYNILHRELSLLQSIKTDKEIAYLRLCCNMSARAHTFVMSHIRPGMTELQCEAMFTAYCAFYGGSRANAYTCICGSGPNGAILHYGHAAHPNSRLLGPNDMIVLDMGGEYNGYATDLTRTYPTNGKFTDKQAQIFNIVAKAQQQVYAQLRPGVSYPAMHKLAEKVIIEGLIEIGILTGTVQQCIDASIGAVFQPHGLGHLLGLNVHGVGGAIDCQKPTDLGVCYLRLLRNLEKGMVITVEPGLYFNQTWIEQQLERPGVKELINTELLAQYWDFGGVRLEDDVVITADGYELLTGPWPSTVEQIENVAKKFY